MAKNKMSRGKKLPKEYGGTIARDTTRYRPGLKPASSSEGMVKVYNKDGTVKYMYEKDKYGRL